MRRHSAFSALVLVIAGCEGIDLSSLPFFGGQQNPSDVGTTQLKRFNSQDEVVSYFQEQIMARNEQLGVLDSPEEPQALTEDSDASFDGALGAAPAPAPPSDGGGGRDEAVGLTGEHSQTTTQEVGVDEADVVKTDGTNLYVLSGNVLRIAQATPADSMKLLSEMRLEGYGRDMYLQGTTVVALLDRTDYGGRGGGIEPFPVDDVLTPEGGVSDATLADVDDVDASDSDSKDDADSEVDDDSANDVDDDSDDLDEISVRPIDSEFVPDIGFAPAYFRPQTVVVVLDVSDPASPRMVSETAFDGSQTSSRMIDGVLYLVLANYQYYFFDILPLLGRPSLDVSEVSYDLLLPRFATKDAGGNVVDSGNAVEWSDLYRPANPDGFGVVTVVTMDTKAGGAFKATGIVAEPGMIYASTEALYITDTNYDFLGNQRENTDVYKLAYVDGSATPVASGNVPGRVLNQYSMGEYQGNLRVATTVGPVFSFFGQVEPSHNNVYVLAQNGGQLEVIGSVENIAPRETIQSARFIGPRGYVVTFEQIDPLFTMDLSDPRNPRVVGELKVPGFSTFILPLDDNHLLAVGQYIPDDGFFNWGVQLSIFDITDFAQPVLRHNVVIGDEAGAYSEALYNPKALTYLAESGLLALPVSIYPKYDYGLGLGAGGPAVGGTVMAGDPVAVDPLPDLDEPPPSDVEEPTDAPDFVFDEVPPFFQEPVLLDAGFEGLYVYRVSSASGFSELGRINSRPEALGQDGFYFYPSFTRGVFIADQAYAVTDLGVRARAVSAMADDAATTELLFPQPQFDPGFDGGFGGVPIFFEGDPGLAAR